MAGEIISVLVVDDDPTFCAVMRDILGGEGYEVHLAYDVRQALALLEHLRPDLILSDIMMPEIDGLTLIRDLRAKPDWAHIPTIVVSARTMPEERTAAREAGADAFVPKPFSIKDLRTTIQSVMPCPVL
jgi:CheY-like chemotaxis protein